VIATLSALAYAFIANTYRSIVAPALETAEGRAGFAAALRPVLAAIVTADALLLLAVGAASFALARSALSPLRRAREREERFAADAAHELRTPLGAIASMAENAELDAAEPARTVFASIARRALECGDLVGDLLTLARASEPDALQAETLDLAIVVQHVVRDAAAAPGSVAIDVTCAQAFVTGDERRLRQLVRNLLDNALAHAASRVAVTVNPNNGDACLRVEDDGPGVPPDVIPRLFERFSKGAKSRGSGLGLAICRWIATAHGGEIAFAGGSQFTVRLPLARPASAAPVS
jgi:two-component system OmpR family sensor kinase